MKQKKPRNSISKANVVEDNDCQEIADTRTAEEEWRPKPRMVVDSFDEVFLYYKNYGNKMGFKVMIRSSKKGVDGGLKYVKMACSCSGKLSNESRKAFNMHLVIKIDCKAHSTTSLRYDGKWKICSTILKLAELRICLSYRKIVGTTLIKLGGHDLVLEMLLQFNFLKMQKENSNFLYITDLDEECRLQNVLWVDARSRATFKEFGDIVTFATTYLTNKYDMSFATFVGVDHHVHSTLLGCGLISHEDTDTFLWLF
ncbi:protein FAR1-RELATED SEQUENCE 2-like [Pistacia vera]|uniref:protein FAR1-RELATED SEQUENCE 2-like n=1 Tax=Pistacia vera TaxID=55513 RepID=UPI0012632E31|nr:protein FAR1-RELATED SEQUENCE 2-like [Pistacia vera]